MNLCTGQLVDVEDKNPSCDPYAERQVVEMEKRSFSDWKMPKCYDIDCSSRPSERYFLVDLLKTTFNCLSFNQRMFGRNGL